LGSAMVMLVLQGASGAGSHAIAEPCTACASAFAKQVCRCATALVREGCEKCWPYALAGYPGWIAQWDSFVDNALLGIAIISFICWLVLPQPLWEPWLCGYGLFFLSLIAFLLWRILGELRTRLTVEDAASRLEQENKKLRATSELMDTDLEMLKQTIGAVGEKGDDWIAQLRTLYAAQRQENDRHSMLLRGHARIVLLQLIQHFDLDRQMRLSSNELRAAEAFLTAGFPDIDIRHLEGKAADGGVSISDLEPLLLAHIEGRHGGDGDGLQPEYRQPRTPARLLEAPASHTASASASKEEEVSGRYTSVRRQHNTSDDPARNIYPGGVYDA